jgi:diadenosine tetraphosphate (Ap4A) HIT family hydrolase
MVFHADVIVAMNALCYARRDKYPVSRGHLLIIPFRHEPDFFSLTDEEKSAIMTLISECKMIIEENPKPAGYHIGFNVGFAARIRPFSSGLQGTVCLGHDANY